ncbi:MAG: tetratricopeptide repeat protein, partial [Pyrinomonadaceae bacterium]
MPKRSDRRRDDAGVSYWCRIGLVILLAGILLPGYADAANRPGSNWDADAFSSEVSAATDEAHLWTKEDIEAAVERFERLSHRARSSGEFAAAAACIRESASLQIILGNMDRSLAQLESSLELEKRVSIPDGSVETLAFLAYYYSVLGNQKQSSANIRKVLARIDAVTSDAARARIYLHLGQAYYGFEDVPNLFKYDSLAYEYFDRAGDALGKAKASVELAFAFLAKEELQKAFAQAESAETLSLQLQYKRGVGMSRVALGLATFKLGRTESAMRSFAGAEAVFPRDIDASERAVLLYNFGRVYGHYGDCQNSLRYFEQAAELLRSADNLAWLVGNLWTLGDQYWQCGLTAEAFSTLNESLRLAILTHKPHGAIQAYTLLGKISTQ